MQAAGGIIALGPFASAVLLFGLMVLVGFLNELLILDLEDILAIEGPLAVILLFSPCAVCWFWLFPVAFPGLAMALFVVGYLGSAFLPPGALFALDVVRGDV